MKKKMKAPRHRQLIKPYLKSEPALKRNIQAAVERLKVITQIVHLREELGLTQVQVAERVGVSQPFIARIESDKASNLSLETLVKIVEALNGEIEIKIRSARKAA